MYNKIIHPITNNKIDIFSKSGKNILKKYLYLITGGAESAEVVTRDSLVQEAIELFKNRFS